MEKSIIKTIIYSDIFDYPLQINEIHRWLIGRKVGLRQVEKVLGKLVQSSKLKAQSNYFFLPERTGLVTKRKRRADQSVKYFQKARMLCQILKVIPWIKLVGISGGLALHNASGKDDIDLFVITGKDRLWISRLLALGLLSLTGQRRKVSDGRRKIAGKLCLNILLEEDQLEQKNKDIFVAHEILQMRPLWQRDGLYSRYLESNSWAFKFLPNWVGNSNASLRGMKRRSNLGQEAIPPRLLRSLWSLAMTGVEELAKWFQLRIMQKPKGRERIEDGALYFHPEDCRPQILSEYQSRIKKLATLDK